MSQNGVVTLPTIGGSSAVSPKLEGEHVDSSVSQANAEVQLVQLRTKLGAVTERYSGVRPKPTTPTQGGGLLEELQRIKSNPYSKLMRDWEESESQRSLLLAEISATELRLKEAKAQARKQRLKELRESDKAREIYERLTIQDRVREVTGPYHKASTDSATMAARKRSKEFDRYLVALDKSKEEESTFASKRLEEARQAAILTEAERLLEEEEASQQKKISRESQRRKKMQTLNVLAGKSPEPGPGPGVSAAITQNDEEGSTKVPDPLMTFDKDAIPPSENMKDAHETEQQIVSENATGAIDTKAEPKAEAEAAISITEASPMRPPLALVSHVLVSSHTDIIEMADAESETLSTHRTVDTYRSNYRDEETHRSRSRSFLSSREGPAISSREGSPLADPFRSFSREGGRSGSVFSRTESYASSHLHAHRSSVRLKSVSSFYMTPRTARSDRGSPKKTPFSGPELDLRGVRVDSARPVTPVAKFKHAVGEIIKGRRQKPQQKQSQFQSPRSPKSGSAMLTARKSYRRAPMSYRSPRNVNVFSARHGRKKLEVSLGKRLLECAPKLRDVIHAAQEAALSARCNYSALNAVQKVINKDAQVSGASFPCTNLLLRSYCNLPPSTAAMHKTYASTPGLMTAPLLDLHSAITSRPSSDHWALSTVCEVAQTRNETDSNFVIPKGLRCLSGVILPDLFPALGTVVKVSTEHPEEVTLTPVEAMLKVAVEDCTYYDEDLDNYFPLFQLNMN